MKFTLTYTKLDGTRASKTYEGLLALERLKAALAKAKADHPDHDLGEVVTSTEPEWLREVRPVSAQDRQFAAMFRRCMPVAAAQQGY